MKKNFMLFVATFLLVSCSGNGDSSGYDYKATESSEMMSEDYAQQANTETGELQDRKIIRTANIRMEVADHEKSGEKIIELVNQYEGEIFQEEEQQYGDEIQHRMTIKLPPENLDQLLKSLEDVATYVDQKSVEKEDVTRNYIDLESRLENKRAVIERYQALLNQAKNVEEVITVEENLRKVLEEVESMERQFKYLQQQINRSTVNLTYYERLPTAVNTRNFGSRILKGFSNGWHLLKDLAIGLISIWPILLIISLLAVWWIRRRRRKKLA